MIKDISLAAYIIPVKIGDNGAQIALLKYAKCSYGPIGGRIDDGEDAIIALRREIAEELGEDAAVMMDNVVLAAKSYDFDVAPERIEKRGAFKESHSFYVTKVTDDMDLVFCEDRPGDIQVEWLPLAALTDENVIGFADMREYFELNVVPMIMGL